MIYWEKSDREARRILAENPGRWEIKYNEKNAPAKALWQGVSAPYRPQR